MVFVKDRQGRYLSINQAGARYMGREVADVIGQTDEALFAPELLRQIRTYDLLVLETGEVRTDEYSEIKDGKRRTFLARRDRCGTPRARSWGSSGSPARSRTASSSACC